MYIPVLQFKWSSTGSLAQLDRVVSCSRKWSVPWLAPICASASWCSWQLNYAPAQIGVPIFRKKVVTKGKSSHCAVLTGFQYFPGGSLQTRGPSLPHLRGWIRVDRGIVVSMQQTHIVQAGESETSTWCGMKVHTQRQIWDIDLWDIIDISIFRPSMICENRYFSNDIFLM